VASNPIIYKRKPTIENITIQTENKMFTFKFQTTRAPRRSKLATHNDTAHAPILITVHTTESSITKN
jgi:hypothetical protein